MRFHTTSDAVAQDVHSEMKKKVYHFQRANEGSPVLFLPLNTIMAQISDWNPTYKLKSYEREFRLDITDAYPLGDIRTFKAHIREIIFDVVLFVSGVDDSNWKNPHRRLVVEIIALPTVEETHSERKQENSMIVDRGELCHVMIFTVTIFLIKERMQ